MNFFHWLREGIRHAVVLGVADACDDIGKHAKDADFGPAFAASLRERLAGDSLSSPAVPGVSGEATRPRKRLGRSLTKPDELVGKAA